MNTQVRMKSPVADKREGIIPFAPPARNPVPDNTDQLERAGDTIMGLLHRASDSAQKNNQRALDLSIQLRAAEAQIKDLDAHVRYYQDRAERAERLLYQISVEIEERFFATTDNRQTRNRPR